LSAVEDSIYAKNLTAERFLFLEELKLKKKGEIKECTAVIEYASFQLAIVLARVEIDYSNIGEQGTEGSLSAKVNELPFSEDPNFFVNSIALSHGLIIFQKAFKYVYVGIKNKWYTNVPKREVSLALFYAGLFRNEQEL
jgi:hypothetical protein